MLFKIISTEGLSKKKKNKQNKIKKNLVSLLALFKNKKAVLMEEKSNVWSPNWVSQKDVNE